MHSKSHGMRRNDAESRGMTQKTRHASACGACARANSRVLASCVSRIVASCVSRSSAMRARSISRSAAALRAARASSRASTSRSRAYVTARSSMSYACDTARRSMSHLCCASIFAVAMRPHSRISASMCAVGACSVVESPSGARAVTGGMLATIASIFLFMSSKTCCIATNGSWCSPCADAPLPDWLPVRSLIYVCVWRS